jgi:hypothetical protein
MKELHNNSVGIGPAIKATFEKVSYVTGESGFDKWYRLDIWFRDQQGNHIIKALFEPNAKDYDFKREYAYTLRLLLNTLDNKKAWESIPRGKTFNDFYTYYIDKIDKHKGKECYIKTLPITHPTEPKFVTANLATDFISLKPMVYTSLEKNQAEEYISKPHTPTITGDFSKHF